LTEQVGQQLRPGGTPIQPGARPNADTDGGNSGLWTIAGDWKTAGFVLGDPPVPVVGTDNYDVLPGGHFVVHNVDVTVGSNEVRAIEIIGERDPDGDGYLVRSFDNHGNAEVMRLTVDDGGTFHFTGGADIAPAGQPSSATIAQVRSTLTISDDRCAMKALWERSADGTIWEPWMDIRFTRADDTETPLMTRAQRDLPGSP
jgi:hypothetical protein